MKQNVRYNPKSKQTNCHISVKAEPIWVESCKTVRGESIHCVLAVRKMFCHFTTQILSADPKITLSRLLFTFLLVY